MSEVQNIELRFDREEAKGTIELEKRAFGLDISVNGNFLGSVDLYNLANSDNEDEINFLFYSMEDNGNCKGKLRWKGEELIGIEDWRDEQ